MPNHQQESGVWQVSLGSGPRWRVGYKRWLAAAGDPLAMLNSLPRLLLLLFLLHLTCPPPTDSQASPAVECNFEKYRTGCYSPANFICDIETNRCKCLPEAPVLIEHRLCIKRAKPNEPCQFNEQCDNSNGYYCSAHSLEQLPAAASITASSTQSSSSGLQQLQQLQHHHNHYHNHHHYQHEYQQPRCRSLAEIDSLHLDRVPDNNSSITTSSQQHYKHQQAQHNTAHHPRHPSSAGGISPPASFAGSILPRLLWLFLIACLVGLVVLLFLIKSQQYRMEWCLSPEVVQAAPHHHQSRSLAATRATAIDVPPPYEVAIRMKS